MSADEFTERPARNSAAAAVGVAALATVFVALLHLGAAGIAAVGVTLLAGGAFWGARSAVTFGATLVLVADLLAATLASGSVFSALAGGALAVAAWDVGEHGISLGEQVGAAARTRHAELVHATVTLAVAVVAVGLGYVIYRAGADRRPVVAILLLVIGALALLGTLRQN